MTIAYKISIGSNDKKSRMNPGECTRLLVILDKFILRDPSELTVRTSTRAVRVQYRIWIVLDVITVKVYGMTLYGGQ